MKERSVPMACFSYVAILGTIAAPLYCGYIDEAIGWRWIEWIHSEWRSYFRSVNGLILSDKDYQYVMSFPGIRTDEEFEKFKTFCLTHPSQRVRGTS